ncbi:hypothetical protein [Enterococcus sp. AZ072]|uniref:hypothetical protein n=1 Tax=unclassified Enterococcus TaxID=2608891 RepID=UPI003D267845
MSEVFVFFELLLLMGLAASIKMEATSIFRAIVFVIFSIGVISCIMADGSSGVFSGIHTLALILCLLLIAQKCRIIIPFAKEARQKFNDRKRSGN